MSLTEQEILECFGQGFDCSQIVLAECAEDVGLTDREAKKIAACFGGGMWYGHECGAVTGALMAIGAKYGHCDPEDRQAKDVALAKMREFREEFLQRQSSCVCKEIVCYDLSDPQQLNIIMEKQLLMTRCPAVIKDALCALEKVL